MQLGPAGRSDASSAGGAAAHVVTDTAVERLEKTFVEVGDLAVWHVSSAKHGNGVAQLRDRDSKTFWQSDGVLPHAISVEFPALTQVVYVAVLLLFGSDESYTPKKLSVRAGTHSHDVSEVGSADVDSPNGWVVVELLEDPAMRGASSAKVWCTYLQVMITENHQNGRDTHVRGMRVFSPRAAPELTSALHQQSQLR
jgi:anaphase-promoting complex subunit 10